LAKWKEVEPSIQRARDEEEVTHKMASDLLSEVEKERAASQREKD